MSGDTRDRVTIDQLPVLVGVVGDDPAQRMLIFDYRAYVHFIGALERCDPPDVELVLSQSSAHAFVIVRWLRFVALFPFIDVIGDIDQVHYLASHPDVAGAVTQGRLASARDHYIFQGYLERRAVRFAKGSGR